MKAFAIFLASVAILRYGPILWYKFLSNLYAYQAYLADRGEQ